MNKKYITALILITLLSPNITGAPVTQTIQAPHHVAWHHAAYSRLETFKLTFQQKFTALKNRKGIQRAITLAQKPVTWIGTAAVVLLTSYLVFARNKVNAQTALPTKPTPSTPAVPSPKIEPVVAPTTSPASDAPKKPAVPSKEESRSTTPETVVPGSPSSSESEEELFEDAPEITDEEIRLLEAQASLRKGSVRAEELEELLVKHPQVAPQVEELKTGKARKNECREEKAILEKALNEVNNELRQLSVKSRKCGKTILGVIGGLSKQKKKRPSIEDIFSPQQQEISSS